MKSPAECKTTTDVRSEIDRVDSAIMTLLGERWGYVGRMWQLKREHGQEANVPWRNREVIERMRSRAAGLGVPPELAEAVWRLIIGWGIQYQDERLSPPDNAAPQGEKPR